MQKYFLNLVISILYITQTSYKLIKNFWGNHDSLAVVNFPNDFGDVLGVQDGNYYHLGQEALESCVAFESFPILALKLHCFICPARGIRHLDLTK